MILSAEEDSTVILQTFRAGASAYLIKHCDEDDLKRALAAVARGQTFLSPEITSVVVQNRLRSSEDDVSQFKARVFCDLSSRERQVLQLIGDGRSSKQIGSKLDVSSKTVDSHRQKVMEKLAAESVADLVKHATQADLTSPLPSNGNH